MFHGTVYERLLDGISTYPVVDCHEHIRAPQNIERPKEAISYLTAFYFASDLSSAEMDMQKMAFLNDPGKSTEEKWTTFSELWNRCKFTAYGRICSLLLDEYFDGVGMSLEGLRHVNEKLGTLDMEFSLKVLEDAKIEVLLADISWGRDMRQFLKAQNLFPEKWRLLFSLPVFHSISSRGFLAEIGEMLGKNIVSIEGYLESVFKLMKKGKDLGMAGIKDQSAYFRTLEYEVVPRADAERLFNRILSDPCNSLGWPERKPLSDYLFHQFMQYAAELDMTVQLHTGHMAGLYNRVSKTNASGLATVLELHKNVRFDLFHGNWPYMGDLLFLAKNYPNVHVDCCWLHIIDPLYAEELLMRALMTVPHSKILGFGGDYPFPEHSAMHLRIARQVIASALSRLVTERGWITEEAAMEIAADWLYNNPNKLFNLDLEPFRP
jgi:hypothetical protein